MNLLLPLILYAVGVIGSIFFIKWRIQKTAFDMFPGGITKSLGEGANGKNRSKVKDLEKKPLDNPEVEDAKILSETTKFLDNKNKIPMFQSNRSQLPDFRDNKRQLFMMKNDDRPVTYNSNSDGKGSYATGIVQRGAIANATGIQHITGPLMQGGLVYNRKLGNVMSLNQLSQAMLNKTRGIGNINQMSQAVLNKTGGIRSINQNPQVMSNKAGVIKNLNQISQSTLNNTRRIGRVSSQGRTSISGPSGRINFRQTGRSYLYGNVNRAQLANGIVRTDRLQIKGFSKVETIIAKRFKDPSRRIAAFRNGIQGKNNTLTLGYRNRKIKKPVISNNGTDRYFLLNSGPNIGMTLNDAFIQRNRKYNLKSERYFLNQDQQLTMLGLKNVYMDPRNSGLDRSQKFKLYALNRITENDRIMSSGAENYMRDRDVERPDYEDWYRRALEKFPNMSSNDIRETVRRAKKLKEAARRQNQMLAAERSDSRINLRNENESSLDNLLKETSVIATNFNNYVENRFQDDAIHTLSNAEIKEIEKQAKENVEEREGISLDDKEKEYQKEIENLKEEKRKERAEDEQRIVKEEILDNPDAAEDILGKEATKALKKEFEKNKRKKDNMYKNILQRQERMKDENFIKRHPEYKNSSYYERHKARVDEEMSKYINTAANQVNLRNNNLGNIGNLADYNTTNSIRYNTNMSDTK